MPFLKLMCLMMPVYFDGQAGGETIGALETNCSFAKCSESVGEAAGLVLKYHSDMAENYPELKLVEAYGFRNRLAHGYETVNVEIVWDTVTIDMPEMAKAARILLNDVAGNDEG